MNKQLHDKLDALDNAIAVLPGDQQSEILAELAQRVSDRATSALTGEQRALVAQRMASPRTYASDAEVKAVLRRFLPGS